MESDISLSLCSDQTLVKSKQCLVDFIHIVVSPFVNLSAITYKLPVAFIVKEESLNLYPASRNDCNTCCLLTCPCLFKYLY